MKSFMDSTGNKILKVCYNNIVYTTDDICPICGAYTADGDVCVNCQKDFGVYEPRNPYSEAVM